MSEHNYPFSDNRGIEAPAQAISFPNLDYPKLDLDETKLTDIINLNNCIQLIDYKLFMKFFFNFSSLVSEDEKLSYLDTIIKNGSCISMEQSMKWASLFKTEIGSLTALKRMLPKVVDRENFEFPVQLFSNEHNRIEWLAYAEGVLV